MRRDVLALTALLCVVVSSLWVRSSGAPALVTVDAAMRAMQTATDQQSGRTARSWDSHEFGGRPQIAEPLTFLYPPILRQWVPDAPLTLISYVLHVWLAGFAIYAAVRYLGLAPIPALALALAFMLATDLALPASAISAEALFRSAWLPLLGAAILAASDNPSWWRLVMVTAAGTVIAAAGSPRTQAYGLAVLIGTYVFAAAWTRRPRWRVAAQGAVAIVSVVALSAPAALPTLRLWLGMQRMGGLTTSEPLNGSWKTDVWANIEMDSEFAQALRRLPPSRVISACPAKVDGIHLRALDVHSVGGYGGVFAADYARFVNLVRNQTITATLPSVGIPEGWNVRTDLLQFLNAEYLVTCAASQGEFVRAAVNDARIYRFRPTLAGAAWTCMPAHVGRKEIEHRLSTSRYDTTLSLHEPGPKINVRWAPAVDDAAREAAEARFHLRQEGAPDDRTRRYELLDASRTNVEALVANPAVEDTAGLDRATFVTNPLPEVRFDERQTEWLIGLEPCPEVRPARLVHRTNGGELTVDIDAPAAGVVFFSETFYPSRTALVDDRHASVMKVNLAFTAVPVSQGRHRVQLGVRSDARRIDWLVAVIGLAGWLGGFVIVRRLDV